MKYSDLALVRRPNNSFLFLVRGLEILNRLHIVFVHWVLLLRLLRILVLKQLDKSVVWHAFSSVDHLFPLLFDVILGVFLVFTVKGLCDNWRPYSFFIQILHVTKLLIPKLTTIITELFDWDSRFISWSVS